MSSARRSSAERDETVSLNAPPPGYCKSLLVDGVDGANNQPPHGRLEFAIWFVDRLDVDDVSKDDERQLNTIMQSLVGSRVNVYDQALFLCAAIKRAVEMIRRGFVARWGGKPSMTVLPISGLLEAVDPTTGQVFTHEEVMRRPVLALS